MERPKVIIFGGIQPTGRHIVAYLVNNQFASEIRVVDYLHPANSYFSLEHQTILDNVEYLQLVVDSPETAARAFHRDDGRPWDYVIQGSFEVRYAMPEAWYDRHTLAVARNVAEMAAKEGCRVLIHLSNGIAFRYHSSMGQAMEEDLTEPRPHIPFSQSVIAAEKAVQVPGIPVVILRCSEFYGPDCLYNFSRFMVFTRLYGYLQEDYCFPSNRDARVATVHVHDVARAVWHLCKWAEITLSPGTPSLIAPGAKHMAKTSEMESFSSDGASSISTNAPSYSLSSVSSSSLPSSIRMNVFSLFIWASMLKEAGIAQTPLEAQLFPEEMYQHYYGMDGSKICRETGFVYEIEKLTGALALDIVNGWRQRNLLP
ncbi:hypothetical protein BJ684DRAFT_7266 [Piptocephalis cylindrospora]|uniref:NAD-dependent epimerase/dehydratase domain-containing protein n=1 Tax=Piptocephalis cylindrospora TaxID=1907219 RepID=A0A4P9Y7Z0_9FUNG|nr:hypothetical protein BJ684DRAFT_7266 [Piptocephalis cylindrospora]|eukprot:RKP15277.1 hypothetical protein BJ684DRAFT_7266 [Piptocephalis cylindrospora]